MNILMSAGLAVLTAVLLPLSMGKAEAAASAAIYDSASREEVTVDTLAKKLPGKNRVVMFGEFHDNAAVHSYESELLKKIGESYDGTVMLSMEMFERDTQDKMDAYLAGQISEEKFLSQARPWANYATDYRPMVEYAKSKSWPVLASNIPRPYASQYAKKGNLEGLDSRWLPEKTYAPADGYQKRFYAVMAEMPNAGMKVPPAMYESMYKAQCIKDDTMAESINRAMNKDGELFVYHVQGEFHGAYHYGVAYKLQQLRPNTEIIVITSVAREAGKTDAELVKEYKDQGEYLVIVDRK